MARDKENGADARKPSSVSVAGIEAEIKGTTPLLMHNPIQLVDPLSPIKKAMDKITSKRARTRSDDEILELRRLEWLGGLFLDGQGLICMPDDQIQGMIVSGAKLSRNGGPVASGISVGHTEFIYPGPHEPDELWKLKQYVFSCPARNSGSSRGGMVIRTRARFNEWSCSFRIDYSPRAVDFETIKQALEDAGRMIGLGDWHRRFGKFQVVKFAPL
jgi:hypothetical protein